MTFGESHIDFSVFPCSNLTVYKNVNINAFKNDVFIPDLTKDCSVAFDKCKSQKKAFNPHDHVGIPAPTSQPTVRGGASLKLPAG